MTRPVNWEPLSDEDPVPGDPSRLEELAGQLSEVATLIREQIDQLALVDAGEIWESDAREAFQEIQEDLPPDLEVASTRYQRVADALYVYAPELRGAQDDAEAALDAARLAQDDIEDAEAGVEAREEWESSAQDAADEHNAANPDAPIAPDPYTGPDHDELLSDAEDRLQQARDDLEDAKDRRDDAAEACEAEINEAKDDELRDPGGIRGFVQNHADVLSLVSDVLGYVAVALAVISLCIPGINLLGVMLLVGVMSLALNTTRLAYGEGSWVDIAFDVVGLATMGVGRFARLGRFQTLAARSARSSRTVRALDGAMDGWRSARTLAGMHWYMPGATRLTGAAARSRALSVLGGFRRAAVAGADDAARLADDALPPLLGPAATLRNIRGSLAAWNRADAWVHLRDSFRVWDGGVHGSAGVVWKSAELTGDIAEAVDSAPNAYSRLRG